jgi:hypothetical protein
MKFNIHKKHIGVAYGPIPRGHALWANARPDGVLHPAHGYTGLHLERLQGLNHHVNAGLDLH